MNQDSHAFRPAVDQDSLNPYQSPRTTDDSLSPLAEDVEDVVLGDYRPRLMPRDLTDVICCLAFSVTGGTLYYALPLGLSVWLGFPLSVLPVIFMISFATAVVVMFSGITGMILEPDRCVAKRRFRRDISFLWRDVKSVRELSRSESLALLSLAPHRGCSQTTTLRGHFRIEGDSGFILFAPRDIGTFRSTVLRLARNGSPDRVSQ